jgi:hypothetical protein
MTPFPRSLMGGPLVLLAGGVLVVGCADAPTSERAPIERDPPTRYVALRGEVDGDRGTLTFSAVPVGGSRIRPAVYGNQGQTIQLYNTPVTTSMPDASTRRFEAQVGVRNLLDHFVGDEQSGASPPAIIGIFVFFTDGPTVTSPTPCAGCTISLVSQHGARTFTAQNQKYFHWQQRLAPRGTAGDTTTTRTTWRFDASAAVTGFRFDVLISAPWVPPHETRWRVEYAGDSIPQTGAEPRWTLRNTAVFGAHAASNGILTINSGFLSGVETTFFRRDSIGTNGNAYITASVRYNGGSVTLPEPQMVLDDGARFIALGIRSDQVGFINASRAFIDTPFGVTTNTYRTYQLSKFGSDSAVFYVDGIRRGQVAYPLLPVTNFVSEAPLFQFGHVTLQFGTSSNWDYVIYEMGTATP